MKKKGLSSICKSQISSILALGLIFVILWSFYPITLHAAPAITTTFTFTLNASSATSAGAYRTDGTLVRTLWRKERYQAGTFTAVWDGKDDDGNIVSAGDYQIKLLSHNVEYVWEGVIGNTSAQQIGRNVHRSLNPISSMAISGTDALYAVSYNEGQPGANRFNTAAPQTRTSILQADAFTAFSQVATDGNYAYWTNRGGINTSKMFVVGSKVSDNSQVVFSTGQAVCLNYFLGGPNCYPNQYWPSVIDVVDTTDQFAVATGIAVQKLKPYLFVAHKNLNTIHVLNKTSGARVRTISVVNPTGLARTATDDLWVIATTGNSRVVQKYVIGSDGSFTLAQTISGLTAPLAIAVSPDDNTLLVADGEASQQIKAFNNVTGAPIWTYGTAGGYAASPNVTNNKFMFADQTFLAFQPDGSFWVGDTGNFRYQHYSSERTFIDRIMYLPLSYNVGIDANNPVRVFNQYLEFEVDYTKPLEGNNNSWRLVKNWSYGLQSDSVHNYYGGFYGLAVTHTLSNGRTYTFVYDGATNKKEIAELPANGKLRFTNLQFDIGTTFYPNGELRYPVLINNIQTVYSRTLAGFDAAGNPQWNAAVPLASAPAGANDPIYRGAFSGPEGTRFPSTTSNVIVSLDNSVNQGWHLGGMKTGGTEWLWKASPSGPLDGLGSYETGAGVNYAGNVALTSGRNIIYGYHGEFWQQTQANQFMHFFDNGLFIGQFGTYGYEVPGDEAVAGFAGNAFTPHLVQVNGQTYLYHNDESNHAGVHRWRINGLQDIRLLSGTGNLGSSITLTGDAEQPTPGTGTGLRAEYYDNSDFTNLKTTRTDAQVFFDWGSGTPAGTTLTSPDTFSVRWTGFVQAPVTGSYTFTTTSDDGVRLRVNNQLLINNWTNHAPTNNSAAINLTAGERYPIVMDYYENAGGAVAKLQWQYPGQSSQAVPQTRLYPVAVNSVVNLVANPSFEQDGAATQTPAGWQTWSPNATESADYTENNGTAPGGILHATHYRSDGDYEVYTYQTLNNLENGIYQLRAVAQSGGGQQAAQMEAKRNSGGQPDAVVSLITATTGWTPVELTIEVINNTCTIGFYSKSRAGKRLNFDKVEFFKMP